MRYYANEQKLVTVSELKGIQCNKCGEIFEPNYDNPTRQFRADETNSGVFTSDFQFDLCEKCLIEIVKQFNIVPDNFMRRSGYVPSYIEDGDLHQELFEKWKLTEEWENDGDNPFRDYIHEDISYDNEEFDILQNMDDRKPLLQPTLKIVK